MTTKFNNSWTCSYWANFGRGDYSETIEIDVPVTDEEFETLQKLEYIQNDCDIFDIDAATDEEIEEAIDASEGHFDSISDFKYFFDKFVEDCEELYDFMERVDEEILAAVREETERAGENNESCICWNYGSVE